MNDTEKTQVIETLREVPESVEYLCSPIQGYRLSHCEVDCQR